MSKFCSKCGKELEINSNFCTNCGIKIDNNIDSSQIKSTHMSVDTKKKNSLCILFIILLSFITIGILIISIKSIYDAQQQAEKSSKNSVESSKNINEKIREENKKISEKTKKSNN